MYTIKTEIALGIFSVFLCYLLYKIFKNRVKIDRNLLRLGLTVIFAAACYRLLEDGEVLPRNFFTVTPGSWLIFLPLGIVEALYFKERAKEFNMILGLLFLLYVLKEINVYALVVLLPTIPLFFIRDEELFYLFFFSALDSITPAFATQFFNYYEQHPIPRFLMSINPILYPIVRLSFAFFVSLVLNRENELERGILYLIIIISAGASIRSFLRFLLNI